MILPSPCKKYSERFLQNGAFSSGLRRGLNYGGWSRMQEKWVFSCTGFGDSKSRRRQRPKRATGHVVV